MTIRWTAWALLLALPLSLSAATPAAQKAAAAKPAVSGKFNGQAAYELTKQYLAVAPHRWVGSLGHAKAEEFIRSHFAPEAAKGNFETDTFTASTPAGMLTDRKSVV